MPHRADFLPLESLGLDYDRLLGTLSADFLRRLGLMVERLSDLLNETVVVLIGCGPIAVVYWGRVALSRVAPEVSDRGRMLWGSPMWHLTGGDCNKLALRCL